VCDSRYPYLRRGWIGSWEERGVLGPSASEINLMKRVLSVGEITPGERARESRGFLMRPKAGACDNEDRVLSGFWTLERSGEMAS
jgi:hypothetical protein